MTVSSDQTSVDHIGNGATTVFAVPYYFLQTTDIKVRLITPSGVVTELVLFTDYTVLGAGNPAGGSVTITVPPANLVTITIYRDVSATQLTNYQPNDDFPAKSHERALDKLTMLAQQAISSSANSLKKATNGFGWDFLGFRGINVGDPVDPTDVAPKGYTDNQLLRTVRAPTGETLTQLIPAASRANKVMGFDAIGNPIATLPATGSGTELALDLANAVDPNKGSALVGHLSDLPGCIPSKASIKMRQIATTSDFLVGNEADAAAKLQAAINYIATNVTKKGQRELVVNLKHNISTPLDIPSNIRIIFEKDAELITTADYVNGLVSQGTVPTTLFSLTVDGVIGSDRVRIGSAIANFQLGSYVWLQSNSIIATSPNINNLTYAQMARVVGIDGGLGELIIDRALEYDFLVSASAKAGALLCRENITIEGFKFGNASNPFWSGVGMDFRVQSNLKIVDANIGFSRILPSYDEAYEVINRNAINLRNVMSSRVDGIVGNQIAWYLISIDGACQDLAVRNAQSSWSRHGISLNWNGPGQPINILVDNLHTSHTTYGGMDTHDVGRDVTFRKIRSRHTKYDGGQIRTSNVLVQDYVAEYCGGNGLLIYGQNNTIASRLVNVRLENIRCDFNAMRGLLADVPVKVKGLSCTGNGIVYSLNDSGGASLPGGLIQDANLVNNNGAALTYFGVNNYASVKSPLTVKDVFAPATANQNVFLNSTQTYVGQKVKLRDSTAVGYTTANLLRRDGSSFISEIDDRGCVWGTNTARKGRAQLASGTVAVAHDGVRIAGTDAGQNWSSSVLLRRITQGAAPGHLSVVLTDSTGFTINSSSGSDSGLIEWDLG